MGKKHVISLFADDVLLYLENLQMSISAVLSSLASFSTVSGYKVNLGKSVSMPLNHTCNLPIQSPFQVSDRGLKYLGIFLTSDLDNLFETNYFPLIEKIKKDLEKWTSLPTSLLGRINVIKMNILPWLNYLFQNLPCYLNTSFFKSLNSHISRYIWNNKQQRVGLSKLCKPKDLGGLSLPNFQLYYWAAQLKTITSWVMNRQDALWIDFESLFCYPRRLESL